MSYTVQNVIDNARFPLNDAAKVRYPDAELLVYFNDALLRVRNRRPDLFLGQWLALPGNKILTDAFPLRDEFVPMFANYITGTAEIKEDEFTENSRAVSLLALFEKALG